MLTQSQRITLIQTPDDVDHQIAQAKFVLGELSARFHNSTPEDAHRLARTIGRAKHTVMILTCHIDELKQRVAG